MVALLLTAGLLAASARILASDGVTPAGSSAVDQPVGLADGDRAPALTGTALDGAPVDLASLRGQPVVVNFWASWCIPCRQEFGVFKTALARHASSGLAVIGVVFDDDASAARAFAESTGATWPSVPDPSRSLASRFRVVAPPQTYFIDRAGIVRNRQIGEIASDAEMDQLLASILR